MLGTGTTCGKVPRPSKDSLLSLFPAAPRSRRPQRSHCPRASLGHRWSLPSTTRTSQVGGRGVHSRRGGRLDWVGIWLEWGSWRLGWGAGTVEGLRTWVVTLSVEHGDP